MEEDLNVQPFSSYSLSNSTNIFIQIIRDKRKFIGVKTSKVTIIATKDCSNAAPKRREAIKKVTTESATVIP